MKNDKKKNVVPPGVMRSERRTLLRRDECQGGVGRLLKRVESLGEKEQLPYDFYLRQ